MALHLTQRRWIRKEKGNSEMTLLTQRRWIRKERGSSEMTLLIQRRWIRRGRGRNQQVVVRRLALANLVTSKLKDLWKSIVLLLFLPG
jgi:hypothetical protein